MKVARDLGGESCEMGRVKQEEKLTGDPTRRKQRDRVSTLSSAVAHPPAATAGPCPGPQSAPRRGSVCPLLLLPSVPPGSQIIPGPRPAAPSVHSAPLPTLHSSDQRLLPGIGAWTSSDGSHQSPNAVISVANHLAGSQLPAGSSQ